MSGPSVEWPGGDEPTPLYPDGSELRDVDRYLVQHERRLRDDRDVPPEDLRPPDSDAWMWS